LAGGDEDELLALRVLLFDSVAIFFEVAKMSGGLFVAAGPRMKWTTMVDESTLNVRYLYTAPLKPIAV